MRLERDTVLRAYGLNSDFPEQWEEPESNTLDNIESQDDNDPNFSLLEQVMLSLGGSGSHASRDEKDPLGTNGTVLEMLASRGHAVNSSDKTKYLLSSTKFQPRLFLRNVHSNATYDDLRMGLRNLQKSIEANDPGLRNIVDDDYDHFVNSKRRLDEVMAQLSESGFNSSNEWGTDRLRHAVDGANARLTMFTRPLDVVGAQINRYNNALEAVDKHRAILSMPHALQKSIDAKDHDQFVRDLKRGEEQLDALKYSNEHSSRQLGKQVSSLVDRVVDDYRSQLWQELMDTGADGAYAPLFARLVDLGVDKNPALEWMEHRINTFRSNIDQIFDDIKTQLETSMNESACSGRKVDLPSYLNILTSNSIDPSVDGHSSQLSLVSTVTPDEALRRLNATVPPLVTVDNSDSLSHWTHLVSLFAGLRSILSDACLFWREKSTHNPKPSSRLHFTGHQDAHITASCTELVHEVCRRLSEVILENSGAPIVPVTSNSLATAKYLGEILDTLSDSLNDVTELMTPQNPLVNTVAVVKQQFVKLLSDAWTRDSTQFGETLRWNASDSASLSRLPEVFEIYHLIILEKLRYLIDSERGGPVSSAALKKVSAAFSASLSLSLKSVNNSLVESERGSTRSQLRPKSMNQDSKLLVTMNNFDVISDKILPVLYSRYDSLIQQQDVQHIASSISPIIDKLSTDLFELFARKKRSRISQIVQHELSRLAGDWQLGADMPTKISNYVYESLMLLVEIRASFLEQCPKLAGQALLVLHEHMLSTILDGIRNMESLGYYGTLQSIADLEFIRSALYKLSSPRAKELCQLIFSAIRKLSREPSLWENEPRLHVRNVIAEALTKDNFAFVSLKTV